MTKILKLTRISTHSPHEVLCVPTCIKIILDNQFKNIQVSRRTLNRWCCFDGKLQEIMGIDALEEHFAPKLMKSKKVKYYEKQPGRIKDLINLIHNKIFIVIIFRLEDYSEWKKKSSISIEEAGSTVFHAMIVTGFDSEKELIYLFDPIYDKYNPKKYKGKNPTDQYDKISYLDFTRLWDKAFDSFMFWFEEAKNVKKEREKHKTLDNF